MRPALYWVIRVGDGYYGTDDDTQRHAARFGERWIAVRLAKMLRGFRRRNVKVVRIVPRKPTRDEAIRWSQQGPELPDTPMTAPVPTPCQKCGHDMGRSRVRDMTVRCGKCKMLHQVRIKVRKP